MKNYTLFFLATLFFFSINTSSQTKFNDIKAGHVFSISLPDYMSRTTGLNDVATFQFKNSVKDVYGIIIEDNKEELKLAEMM